MRRRRKRTGGGQLFLLFVCSAALMTPELNSSPDRSLLSKPTLTGKERVHCVGRIDAESLSCTAASISHPGWWMKRTSTSAKTATSHPSRAGSRGTGWPQWLPCQSRLKRRKPPRPPDRRQSYEDCLPQLPSQPAEKALVLGTQRRSVSLKLILRL